MISILGTWPGLSLFAVQAAETAGETAEAAGKPLGFAWLLAGLALAAAAAWRWRTAGCDWRTAAAAAAAAAAILVAAPAAPQPSDAAPGAWSAVWLAGGLLLGAASWAACRRLGCGAAAMLLAAGAAAALATGSPLQPHLAARCDYALAPVRPVLGQPLFWALLLGVGAMLLLTPPGRRSTRIQGAALGIISLGFWAMTAPPLAGWGEQGIFWILAAVTVASAAFAISMPNAVYAAIWFALSLVGTAGLFFYQGAQFLGVATIVVYAGAIVVTFLFVVMLAQPEGQAVYDRITWGAVRPGLRGVLSAKPLSVLASATLVAAMAYAVASLDGSGDRAAVARALPRIKREGQRLLSDAQLAGVRREDGVTVVYARSDVAPETADQLQEALSTSLEREVRVQRRPQTRNLQQPSHMAALGAELMTQHLLSVEIAGTLLLAALVGAIAIAIQGRDGEIDQPTTRRGPDQEPIDE